MRLKKFIVAAVLYSCQIMAVVPTPTAANFMNTLSGDIKLRNLSLLGSHDAGTYNLNASMGISPDEYGNFIYSIGNIPFIGTVAKYALIKKWSQVQNQDITHQLSNGVRYFDLRIALDSQGQFRICHGLYGPLIDDICTQLNNFLISNPEEVVLVDFQQMFDLNGENMSFDHQNQLLTKIQQFLGSKIAPSSYGADVTLGELRQTQKQLIIFWGDSTTATRFPLLLWDRSIFLSSPWPNATSWAALQPILDQGIAQQPQEKFFVNQAVLTPDAEMIATNLFSSLLSVEEKTNESVIQWYQQKAVQKLIGNILLVDNEATICQQAFQISMNYNNQLSP